MELLQALLSYIQGKGQAWVVGGALRDCLLDLPTPEVDVASTIAPGTLPTIIWGQAASCFWLDEARQIMRITQPTGLALDIAPLQGDAIEADLSHRDFTVNAMALRLEDWISNQGTVIDPLAGQQDLAARRLRLVGSNALLADPVRVLRGIRLAITKDLTIEATTMQAMQQAAPQLSTEAAERVAAELGSCFRHPRAAEAADLLLMTGVTPVLFSEVAAMQQVTQNKYHQFTVDEHSRKAFAAFVDIVHKGRYLTPRAQAWFAAYWSELAPTLQTAAMLAAWLHDIGKPPTRVIRQGRVTFYDHEQVGAEMTAAIAKRLKLSNAQQDLIKRFVRMHMYPMQLWRAAKFGPQHIHRFYRRAGQYGPLIVAFTLADHLAKGDNLAETEEFATHQQMVEDFLHAYFCRKHELIAPEPLLNGLELISLAGRQSGPWLRKAKQDLLEAQVVARVKSKADAARWLEGWLRQQ